MNAQTEHIAEVEQRFNRARLQLYAKRNGEEMLKRMESDMMSPSDKAWVREARKVILGDA
jgi:hypothetical protein